MPEPRTHGKATARVVVVDDSVSVCKAIERMLRPLGHVVVGIHSGREAVARLEGEKPDLLICDMVLPDLEGAEVCQFARRSPVLAEVPVVAISGVATEEVRRRAVEAGADAVLKKPFRSGALIAQIEALLASRPDPSAPSPAPDLDPLLRILAELEALPGLAAGSWRLAGGQAGRFGSPGASDDAGDCGPDAEAVLARMGSFAASVGFGRPSLALLEAEAGGVLLVAQRERRGVLCLELARGGGLGKARYLAGKFLRVLDPGAPSISSD